MKKKLGMAAILTAISLIAVSAKAQDVAAADVRVQSVSVGETSGRLVSKISVFSYNDDDAQQVNLIVLLPFQTRVLSMSAGCSVVPNPSLYPGSVQTFVRCFLGTIPVGVTKGVVISTTKPPAGIAKHFAAFAWSIVPDPNSSNNFGEATAP